MDGDDSLQDLDRFLDGVFADIAEEQVMESLLIERGRGIRLVVEAIGGEWDPATYAVTALLVSIAAGHAETQEDVMFEFQKLASEGVLRRVVAALEEADDDFGEQ